MENTNQFLSQPVIISLNLLSKSKYCFFDILSYNYSRIKARMLLNQLSKRGRDLSDDSYLNTFKSSLKKIRIRSPE